MVIDNQIFHAFRQNEKEIKKAINLLKKNKFTIFDPQGNRVYEKKKTV